MMLVGAVVDADRKDGLIEAVQRRGGLYNWTDTADADGCESLISSPETSDAVLKAPLNSSACLKCRTLFLAVLPAGESIPADLSPIPLAGALRAKGLALLSPPPRPEGVTRWRAWSQSHTWGEKPEKQTSDLRLTKPSLFGGKVSKQIVAEWGITATFYVQDRRIQGQPVGFDAGSRVQNLAAELFLSGSGSEFAPNKERVIELGHHWLHQLPADIGDGPCVEQVLKNHIWHLGLFPIEDQLRAADAEDTVRQIGEIGRGVVNLASEFGKAAFDGAGIFGEMAARVPELQNLFRELNELVKSAQEFKLDPKDVERFAVAASKDLLKFGATIADTITEWGKALNKEVLKPIKEMFQEVKDAKQWYDALSGKAGRGIIADNLTGRTPNGQAKQFFPAGAKDDTFAGMEMFSESLKRLATRVDGIGEGLERARAEQRAAEAAAKDFAEFQARRAQQEKERRVFHDFFLGRVGEMKGVTPGDPLAGISGYLLGAEKQKRALDDGFGAGWIVKGVKDVADPSKPNWLPGNSGLTAHQQEISRRWKDDFDPSRKLMRDLKELEDVFKGGGLTRAEFDFAKDKEIRRTADSLGIGGPTRLPEAALRDSAESVRIINQWQAQSGQQTVEDLLRQLIELTRARSMKASDFESVMMAARAVVSNFQK